MLSLKLASAANALRRFCRNLCRARKDPVAFAKRRGMDKILPHILKISIIIALIYLSYPRSQDGIYDMTDIRAFIVSVAFCICLILDI